MYDFTFHRPATVDDAVKLLQSDDDAKLMAVAAWAEERLGSD